MQRKTALLFISFFAFYTMAHTIRHLPELMNGRLHWKGEKTYTLSIIRIAADMAIAFLFTWLPYLLFHQFYRQRKWPLLVGLIALSFADCFLLSFFWTSFMEQPVKVRLSNYLPQAVFFFTMYAVLGTAFYFIQYSHYKEVMEKENLLLTRQSELSFLRSQINPHFLFNNLNNIYALVFSQSDQSLNAIANLSELLRYMLYDTSEIVTLSKEIVYIEKYIALKQLKYEHPENISFIVDGPAETLQIPPLLFIPFVENAFKHGDNNEPNWLHIELKINENHLVFSCINKKVEKCKDAEGGIGIANVKRRLELLYIGQHKLTINEDQSSFTVKLHLNYGN